MFRNPEHDLRVLQVPEESMGLRRSPRNLPQHLKVRGTSDGRWFNETRNAVETEHFEIFKLKFCSIASIGDNPTLESPFSVKQESINFLFKRSDSRYLKFCG